MTINNYRPHITVIKERTFFSRPVLWLMCPSRYKVGRNFQVGEFRNWKDAILAKERLKNELSDRVECYDNKNFKPVTININSCDSYFKMMNIINAAYYKYSVFKDNEMYIFIEELRVNLKTIGKDQNIVNE